MRPSFLLLLVLLIIASSRSSIASSPPLTIAAQVPATELTTASWAGSYTYNNSPGKNLPGTPILVTYTLTIPKDPAQPARLTILGYQSNESLRCAVSLDGQTLTVRFLSFSNGKIENAFGVAEYEPNAVLFTLSYPGDGSPHKTLSTEWKALKPDNIPNQFGKYFTKVHRTKHNATAS